MKALFALVLAFALGARPASIPCGPQVWEEGRTILTIRDSHEIQYLLALDNRGKSAGELQLPESLRFPSLSHWKGRSFAYGFPDHPAWHLPDFGKRAWRFPPEAFGKAYERSEQHLYQSTDFQTWHLLARYRPEEDRHGHIRRLLPLEDGSFLAFGIFNFWEWDRVSPVARYRVDGRGHLMFARLVELGPGGICDTIPHPTLPGQRAIKARPGYEGIEGQNWLTARAPEGLVLIHRGGWYFVLDNRDGHCLRQGRIPPPEGRTLEVLDVEPRPNGRILVASVGLRNGDKRSSTVFPQPGDSPSTRLARQLMYARGKGSVIDDLEGPVSLAWHSLNPATGLLGYERPPCGVPTILKDREARWNFRFTIRPDGNLEIPPQGTGLRVRFP